MRLIDCTLRDGGYHNNWNFSQKFAEETFRALAASGILDIEIGFRKPAGLTSDTEGIFANLNFDLLKELNIPKNSVVGLMINASDFISASKFDMDLLKESFPFPESKLNFVRLACGIDEIESLPDAKKYLEGLGYEVHLNLMQANRLLSVENNTDSTDSILEQITRMGFRFLTLADTYGVIRENQLKNLIEKCLQNIDVNLGLHLHNNIGLATSNSLVGLNLGVAMLDSTITGMGRGPGNLRTEFITNEISHRDSTVTYDSKSLLAFAARKYEPLKEKYKWGENSYYFLGAEALIHPSYVQYLTQKNDYSAEEIIEAISILGKENRIRFSEQALTYVFTEKIDLRSDNSKSLPESFNNMKSVIILGAGESVQNISEGELRQLIEEQGDPLLSLTLRPPVSRMLIDAYLVLDPVKFFIDYKLLESHQSLVITPNYLRREGVTSPLHHVLPFGLEENCLDFRDGRIVLPFPSSLGYALMCLVGSGVLNIKLAGFDGFEESDSRQIQNQTVLNLFCEKFGKTHRITFLTPTSYTLPI